MKQPISAYRLDPVDTLRFKGLGILLIVLHNFFRLVCPLPRENEFTFSQEYAQAFRQAFFDGPQEILRCLFSFWGHFGVQIFIFLSAYGLTQKFLSATPSYGPFIASRYRKIYPFFLAAVAMWLTKIALFSGPAAAAERLFGKDLLLALLGISNLVPGQALAPVGPWWFISFIFQFYLVFPFLYRFWQKTGGTGLLCLGVGGIVFTATVGTALRNGYNINLYFTWIAHLPELCLGVYVAGRQKPIPYAAFVVAAAGAVFALGNVYANWWYLNHISALILLLAIESGLRPLAPTLAGRVLLFYGRLSLPLFLVNAYLRQPLISFAQRQPHGYSVIFYALLFLLLATAAAATIDLGLRFLQRRKNPLAP